MRHVITGFASVISLAFAGVFVWFNRTHLTTPILGASLALIGFAWLLALPTDAKTAIATLKDAIFTIQPPKSL